MQELSESNSTQNRVEIEQMIQILCAAHTHTCELVERLRACASVQTTHMSALT